MRCDLIVVGGGPAGMIGAAEAASRGLKVVLVEKNAGLGRKLLLTGNGRCNVTNNNGEEDFFANVVTNKKFLYSAYKSFNSRRLIELLHSLGVPTKVETGGRVFPASDKSRDVVEALTRHMRANNVEILFNTGVGKILTQDRHVTGVLLNDGKIIPGKKVLIATGGASYRQTGSTGDGYNMARELGHSVMEPTPALVPLVTRERWAKELQGLALQDTGIKLLVNQKVKAKQFGEIIFTHFGVSGPAILRLSSFLKSSPDGEVKLHVDLKPGLSETHLEQKLLELLRQNAAKNIKNVLADIVPQRMAPAILALSEIDPQGKASRVTRQERKRIAGVIKNLELTVTGTRTLNEAIVTSGGVNVKEINPSTMESKVIAGLYFAGEVIDVDALTGGYNLQIAFSTGYLAGASAAG